MAFRVTDAPVGLVELAGPGEEFAQGPEESDAEQPRTPPCKRVTETKPSDA